MERSDQTLAALLYDRKCPFDYQCKAVDCVECVKIHMEKEGRKHKIPIHFPESMLVNDIV